MKQIERPFNNPYEDEPECEIVCPNCEGQLDWGDRVYVSDGKIIGCEWCTASTDVSSYIEETEGEE